MPQRPQVNTNLGQPELVSSVARPMRDGAPAFTTKQSRAGALASSLISIAPTLQGYVQEFQKDYQEDEANRAYDEIQGMTFDAAQTAVKEGTMRDTESPWYQAAFEKQFGTVFAQQRRRELVESYNNDFDKHNGNLNEFIAGFAGEDLEKFGGSEFIMSGYRTSMRGTLGQLQDQHAEWKSTWTRDRVGENFGTMAYDTVTTTVAEGGDLNAALGALRGEHRDALGMTFKETDELTFGMASRLAAEGNVDALNALLNTEIVGPDGTVVGTYMTRPAFAEKAAAHLAEARAVAGASSREANTATVVSLSQTAADGKLDMDLAAQMRDEEQITPREYEGLVKSHSDALRRATVKNTNAAQMDELRVSALEQVRGGNAYLLQDHTYIDADGKQQTYTRQQMLDDAVGGVMDHMASTGTRPGLMAEELASYGVDYKYGPWENLLSDSWGALTNAAAAAEDGTTEIPELALKGFTQYMALSETPNLRSQHINNPDAERVWSTAALLVSTGKDPADALMAASAPPSEAGQAAANSFSRQEFTNLTSSIRPGMFGDTMLNGAAALGTMERLAKFAISRGVPKAEAVENAIEDYEGSHTTINGTSVNTRNVHVPPNFEEVSGFALDGFAEQFGEDADDLTLVPAFDGSNYWTVVTKGDVSMPVQIAGANKVLHISEINRTFMAAKEAERELEATIARASAEAAIATRGAELEVAEQTAAAFQEWQGMTRIERKDADLPTSISGAQLHFSINSALRAYRDGVALEERGGRTNVGDGSSGRGARRNN